MDPCTRSMEASQPRSSPTLGILDQSIHVFPREFVTPRNRYPTNNTAPLHHGSEGSKGGLSEGVGQVCDVHRVCVAEVGFVAAVAVHRLPMREPWNRRL